MEVRLKRLERMLVRVGEQSHAVVVIKADSGFYVSGVKVANSEAELNAWLASKHGNLHEGARCVLLPDNGRDDAGIPSGDER